MPFLQAGGSRLEYEWYGPKPEDALTLVFLHGGLGSGTAWGDYPERLALALDCGALAYSRIGYGNSDPVNSPRSIDFMHQEALAVLPDVLGALQIRQAVLIGHSDGGSIALIYSGSKAAKVSIRALVLEAPHVFVEDITISSIAAAVENYHGGGLRVSLQKYHGNVDNTFESWSRVWLDPAFRSWNITEYLPHIVIPVLVIQGKQDNFGTTLQVELISHNCGGPVQKVIFPNCGHRPHRRHPELTLRATVDFLRTHMVNTQVSRKEADNHGRAFGKG